LMIYRSLALNEKPQLPPLAIQYKDFALWQRTYLQGEVLEKQLNYWKEKLSGYERLNLPVDKIRPANIDYNGRNIDFELSPEVSEKLRILAKETGVSLYSLLLSAFYLLLSTYSNQKDIVVGSPIANRNYKELEGIIGFFVNTLALRQVINPEQEIVAFIKQVGDDVNQAQLHQDLPFEKLVDELNIEKDISQHPIFQVVFQVVKEGFEDVNKHFCVVPVNEIINVSKFDLTVSIEESDKNIVVIFNYAVSLFERKTIEGYMDTYRNILDQLSDCLISSESMCINEIDCTSGLSDVYDSSAEIDYWSNYNLNK